MKKVVKILIMAFAISLGLSLGMVNNVEASASSYREGGEYVISNSSDGYTLSYLGDTISFDSINDCLCAISNPGVIKFSYVTCDELIVLPQGEYEISGKLHSNGMVYIPTGAKVTMSDMTATLGKDSYIRIKGGMLSIASSSISGDDRIIKLDYSASSRLEVISGRISGDSDEALIDIECGQAVIRGADIENSGGAAIRSDSELCLMGSPKISGATYGILLESPMYMGAYSDEYYSQTPLSIQYMGTFSQGTLTEIFYEVNERSLGNIIFYDKNGKEEEITHFETSIHTAETKFAGVYLPHTVKFFIGDNVVAEQKLLSGERISPVIPDDIVGYEFDNWYKDREGNDAYTSDKRVYSSFSLYGIYSLDAPTFGISSLDFTYDGQERTLAFDYLSHPLEGGYYTYTWYKNGIEISDLSQINVKSVLDSGTYSCRVTYNLIGNSATVFAENIKVNIEKQSVLPPSIPKVKYNGLPQYPSIDVNNLYSVDMIYGIDVGTYPVVITLADTNNFSWDGATGDSITLEFEILKADNSWVSMPCASDFYIGFPMVASAVSRFGTVEFIYSATENGVYTTKMPTSIGSYYVKAIVPESENYSSLVSDPIRFSILAEEVVGLQLVKMPDKAEYMSFDTFDPTGMEVAAIYNSGRREVISSSRLSYTYNDGKSLRVGDAAVVVEYLGASLPIPIYVSPLTYDLSSITFSSASITYDGKYHTIPFAMEYIFGLDGVPLVYEAHGGGTDVGEYQVEVKFSTESRDYTTPEAIVSTLTILPKTVELVWNCPYFVYDSTPKIPSASFTDVMGVRRSVSVCGSAILAGSGYSATAVEYSNNYVFSNPSYLFDIAKADYDMSSAYWSGTEFIYNGELIEVTVSNLPSGVSVAGYTDNRARDVGKYVATASLRYDERNYNPPNLVSFEWEIKPAEYDMSSLQISSSEYEYDGNEHFPLVSGTPPVGFDGIPVSYAFSGGATNVSDGEVLVTITFATESKNYITPDSVFAKVKIVPKGIYVDWSCDSFTYDGNIKTPIAESHIAPIRVNGGKINAGSYVALAESEDSNYAVINSTFDYKINKATNYWLTPPSILDFYESGSPNPSATSLYGNAEFRYYEDEALSTPVTVLSPGEYFMVATVQEGDNYLRLSSSPIRFNCIEVVPTDMYVEVNGELIAFSGAENSLFAYLIYNDGAEESIPIESVFIKYQNGESLRCKDTHIEISYMNFQELIPIKVNPSTYDTSLVYWEDTDIEYDGLPHTPSIFGLPGGISVIEYIGAPGVSAGEYQFSAVFSYDEENYLPPEVSPCTLIVRKAVVPCVSDLTVEYNGKSLELESNDFYSPAHEIEIKNSGEYLVQYKLTDDHNYVFENGMSGCTAKIIVLPRQIKVVVSDASLHWLEESPMYSSRIEGEIADGDLLNLQYYIEGDRIYVRCDNPNYFLSIESGMLKKLPYPNEYLRGKIISAVLFLITVALMIVIIFKKRSDILDAIFMLRAKNKHRQGVGYINNAPITAISTSDTPPAPITINLSTNDKDVHSSIVSIDQATGSIVLSTQLESSIPGISKSKVCIESYKIEKKLLPQITPVIDSKNDVNDEADISTDSANNENTNEDREDIIDSISLYEDSHLDFSADTVDDVKDHNDDSNDTLLDSSKDDITLDEIEYEDDLCISSVDTKEKLDNELESLAEDDLDIGESEFRDPISSDFEDTKNDEPRVEIKMEYANAVITDAMARRLIKEEEVIYTNGKTKSIINVDTLSRNFIADDRVDVNILKKKSLVPYDTGYIKVLARGAIDKPLKVLANEFSLSAVKMILLSGGEAIRVISKKEEKNKTNK